MTEFQTLQDFVLALLTRMESQISWLGRAESEIHPEDEEQVEEKDHKPMTKQSNFMKRE